MRFPPTKSSLIASSSGSTWLTVAVFSLVCWTLLADQAGAAGGAKAKAKKKAAAAQRETIERGRLTSFQEGVLKLRVRELGSDVWKDREWKIPSGAAVVSYIRGVATQGTSPEAFKPWEQNPGVMVVVRSMGGKVRLVEIGAKKAPENPRKKPADEVAERILKRGMNVGASSSSCLASAWIHFYLAPDSCISAVG